ncbi:MAG: hypothetical protein HY823_10320 [Acidobacteria bacterium]|nr:hypothetical protein [Acidobacteriota bacterium]
MIFGEAPGPRGAEKSGIPFWGDRAGLPLYRVLQDLGLASFPPACLDRWDGQTLKNLGLVPSLRGVALSNAFPRCPTSDGEHFRAPTHGELMEKENLARLRAELGEAAGRGLRQVLTLGRRAAWVLERLDPGPPCPVRALPHPSAQGLLQAAPGRGKGLRLAVLQRAWEQELARLLGDLFPRMS